MKSPISRKEMTLRLEKKFMVFRKEEFEYNHKSYYCIDSGEEFTTTELDEFNLNQVYNQYRDNHNIPFPDEIIKLRKKYDLSASMMSRVLGLGANSYRNYEKGEVPNLANANLINTVLNSIRTLKLLVDLNNDLSVDEKSRILKKIDNVIEDYDSNKKEINFLNYLFEERLPDNYSGYIKPSIEKLSNMILFFAEKLSPSETMMNKLLFYSDFLNYRNTAYSISGTNYMAHNYGPVPFNYGSLFDFALNKGYFYINVEDYGNGYVGKCFYKSKRNFNVELFNSGEIESLNIVANTFKGCNATQIKDKSHEEKAWIENEKQKGLIDYKYAFDLKHV